MNFRPLNDVELAELSDDEELVDYISRARTASRLDDARMGAQILAWRQERRVGGFVANRLSSKGPQVVENVAARTIADAIKSAASFEGGTVEEFRAWVFRIARRRLADYHRKKRVDEVPIDVDWGEGSEEREFGEGDPIDAVDRASVFNQAYSELQQDSHKLVIVLSRFRDLAHKDVAAEVTRHFGDRLDDPMTEQNVNKINSRFDKRLDELLEEADDPTPDHD